MKANITHYLNVEDGSSEVDVLFTFFSMINGKPITKSINGMDVTITWLSCGSDFMRYVSSNLYLGDVAVHEHTKLILAEFRKLNSSDIKLNVTKPLSRKLVLL